MKLIKLSLILISMCFLNNSYAMEREFTKEQIATDLSRARELVKKAHDISGDVWYMSCMGHFATDEDLNAYKSRERDKILKLAEQAEPLAKAIVANATTDKQAKRQAGDILADISKLVKPDNQ